MSEVFNSLLAIIIASSDVEKGLIHGGDVVWYSDGHDVPPHTASHYVTYTRPHKNGLKIFTPEIIMCMWELYLATQVKVIISTITSVTL